MNSSNLEIVPHQLPQKWWQLERLYATCTPSPEVNGYKTKDSTSAFPIIENLLRKATYEQLVYDIGLLLYQAEKTWTQHFPIDTSHCGDLGNEGTDGSARDTHKN